MVVVAQLVRASGCGSEGRRFDPDLPPWRAILYLVIGYIKINYAKKTKKVSLYL